MSRRYKKTCFYISEYNIIWQSQYYDEFSIRQTKVVNMMDNGQIAIALHIVPVVLVEQNQLEVYVHGMARHFDIPTCQGR